MAAVPLRESVSSWIVSGSEPELSNSPTLCAEPISSYFQPSLDFIDQHAIFMSPTELENEAKASLPIVTDWTLPECGKKRSSLNFSLDKITVAPQQVFPFEQVFGTITELSKPLVPSSPAKKQKIIEEEPICFDTIPTPDCTPEPDFPREEVLAQGDSLVTNNFIPPPSVAQFQPCSLSYTISFGKRANGNQRWEPGCLAPPKIGKMRRMTCKITSDGASVPVTLVAKCVDLHPGDHKGKLILSSSDRTGIKKSEAKKSQPQTNEIRIPINLSEVSTEIEYFLKPEWNGLGEKKLRPRFDISLILLNERTGESFPLLTWETELQSHKFESSPKGKAMESTTTHSKTKTITLA